MTAHNTIPFDDPRTAAAEVGGVIIQNHVGAEADAEELDHPALALARLKTFLQEEGPGLAQVFSLLDLIGAQRDLDRLRALLKVPGDTTQTLADAEEPLERMLEDLADVPARAEIQRPMRRGEEAIVRDLDAWIRWCGARTEEMRNLVRHVLG